MPIAKVRYTDTSCRAAADGKNKERRILATELKHAPKQVLVEYILENICKKHDSKSNEPNNTPKPGLKSQE